MSRIGKLPVPIPSGVQISTDAANVVTAKGPKGELRLEVDRDIIIKVEDGKVVVTRPTEQKRHKSMHGLYRMLISNMITGVTNGYTKNLELVGIGYRAAVQGQILDLTVGYSHNVMFSLPKEVKAVVVTEKGKNPVIKLECIDKQLLGQVAAKIRSVRPPEPYKGKGIKYADEIIRRKAGKAVAAK